MRGMPGLLIWKLSFLSVTVVRAAFSSFELKYCLSSQPPLSMGGGGLSSVLPEQVAIQEHKDVALLEKQDRVFLLLFCRWHSISCFEAGANAVIVDVVFRDRQYRRCPRVRL